MGEAAEELAAVVAPAGNRPLGYVDDVFAEFALPAGSMLQIVCIWSMNSSSEKLESTEDMYTLPLQAALIRIAVLAADINSEWRRGVAATGAGGVLIVL